MITVWDITVKCQSKRAAMLCYNITIRNIDGLVV